MKDTRLICVYSMNTLGGGVAFVCVILKIGFASAEYPENHTTEGHPYSKQSNHELTSHTNIKQTSVLKLAQIKTSISTTTLISTSSPISSRNSTPHLTSITPTSFSVPTSLITTTSISPISQTSLSTNSASSASISSAVSSSPATPNALMSSKTLLPTSAISSSTAEVTVTSTIHYIPYSDESTTVSSANKSSSTINPDKGGNSGLDISSSTALGIFLVVLLLVIAGSFVTYILKKRGYLSCKSCLPVRRKRRSSTSSRGPLTQDDATFVNISDPPRQERELFSIGDQDGGQDGRHRAMQRRGTEDDYFYDEIFGQSAFVDETTNRANTYLSVADDDDDDILGSSNIPDLIFKTPKKI